MKVEQAIFTSTRTARGAGYQLVARSAGVTDADARELAAWGPSHDSLLESGSAAESINFHPLPSGAYCIGQTTPEGAEFSGRGGARVYTQSLIVSPEALARFHNNPFAVLRAALAMGEIGVPAKLPPQVPAFDLLGRAAPVDEAALNQLAHDPGPLSMAAAVEAALRNATLGIAAGKLLGRLIAGLFQCLPVECRPEFSFATGLKFTPCRPFRLNGIPMQPLEIRRLRKQFGLGVLEIVGNAPSPSPTSEGWGGLVAWVLRTGRVAPFARQLARPRPGLTAADLDALASEVRTALNAGDASPRGDKERGGTPTRAADARDGRLPRADGAHRRAEPAAQATIAAATPGATGDPADALGDRFPTMQAALQGLEDSIFEVLAGKTAELPRLRQQWRDSLTAVGPRAAGELRERFLRLAVELWRQLGRDDPERQHHRAPQALDVICLIVEETQA